MVNFRLVFVSLYDIQTSKCNIQKKNVVLQAPREFLMNCKRHWERDRVIEMDEIWHFKNIYQYDPMTKSGGIFTEYVNTFL